MNTTQPVDRQPTPSSSPRPRQSEARSPWGWWLLGVLLLLGLLALGTVPRLRRTQALAKDVKTNEQTATPVQVVCPPAPADTTSLWLPGSTQAYRETFINARVSGYVKNWYADIGTRVRKGQLLAVIETPELDQQLQQAQANVTLADVSLKRLQGITMPGAVSKQSLDDRQGAYDVAQAALKQVQAMRAFNRVVAPFAGIVSVRNIDVGSLVNAGASTTGPLFRLDRVDSLRIFINVPQSAVESIRPGLSAYVTVAELPGRSFRGRVVRTAGVIDATTRTLLTEVHLPNPKGDLYAGMYAQVGLLLHQRHPPLVLPAETLVIDGEGTRLAVVGANNKLHYRAVQLGRDFGATVEVVAGLNPGEAVVLNPGDDLTEGQPVRIVNQP